MPKKRQAPFKQLNKLVREGARKRTSEPGKTKKVLPAGKKTRRQIKKNPKIH